MADPFPRLRKLEGSLPNPYRGRFTSRCQEGAHIVRFGLSPIRRITASRVARIDETTVDQLAEAVLRLLGVPAPEAARLAALPLPPTDTW